MRYFTSELWLNFQKPRARDAAFKTWGRRFKAYRKSLEAILPSLNSSAQRFFRDPLILHDGTLTRMEVGDRIADAESKTLQNRTTWQKVSVRLFVLDSRAKQRCYRLKYDGVERVELDFPGKQIWFPSGTYPNLGDWGYDELTFGGEGLFRHEILFASGASILVDFRQFSVRRTQAR